MTCCESLGKSPTFTYFFYYDPIFTARIRSQWEGNVFSRVSLSVCSLRGGGGPHVIDHMELLPGPGPRPIQTCSRGEHTDPSRTDLLASGRLALD